LGKVYYENFNIKTFKDFQILDFKYNGCVLFKETSCQEMDIKLKDGLVYIPPYVSYIYPKGKACISTLKYIKIEKTRTIKVKKSDNIYYGERKSDKSIRKIYSYYTKKPYAKQYNRRERRATKNSCKRFILNPDEFEGYTPKLLGDIKYEVI